MSVRTPYFLAVALLALSTSMEAQRAATRLRPGGAAAGRSKAPAVVPASQEPKNASNTLDEVIRQQVDALLASDLDPRAEHDAIWRATCTFHGELSPLISYLGTRTGSEVDPALSDRACRLLARVQRRAGYLFSALRTLGSIDASRRSLDDEIARAEILDAVGKTTEAVSLYGDLLARELTAEMEKKIHLRRALMGKGTDGLSAFAKNEANTAEQRNEASVILAIRGDQKTAIRNFVAAGEGTPRFRQEIRRAEWAMEAEQYDDAQTAAWAAVREARLTRDRRYALSVLASAYRRDEAVGELLAAFEAMKTMEQGTRELWVRLLREEGRTDDALRLFDRNDAGAFDSKMRRQLLEICRETGREEVLIKAFERLIREEPENLEWRSGLSRHYLEKGERKQAIGVWKDLDGGAQSARQLMGAAYSLEAIGLDDIAERLARQAAEDTAYRSSALMFVFRMHLQKGSQETALSVLAELAKGSPSSGVQAEIADGYERLGRPDQAVATLESLRQQLGGFLGTDLEMKFAVQLSRVEREEEALVVWRALWSRMRSTPRGRFVEDRMMTVASRLGVLAKIAIELEDRLESGAANTEDVELLVRLYIKVGDPASATEIVEEFMKQTGSEELAVLKRKAKIYLSCQDYHHYEAVILLLVEKDHENRLDHLRELAMSQLERGRRDLCVELLPRIRRESGEDSSMADEFEAGVYGLVGMPGKSLEAYIKGMGRHPERIDTYLLISNLMRDTGSEMAAVRMFQYLAQTADRDDLFTIAIDGILNLRAPRGNKVPTEVVHWALRTTLERLATRPDKFYLYRLVTDLASELNDLPLAIRTLKSALPVAGERRTPVMRELMSKVQQMDPSSRRVLGSARFAPSKNWNATDYVMVGRRLLGQGDHVPPQTFMDLATVFLREGDTEAAIRTFNRAAEVLDYSEVLREAARVLEDNGRTQEALSYYKRLLAAGSDDVQLLLTIGSLHEQIGETDESFSFYRRGLGQILDRKPRFVSHSEEKKAQTPYGFRSGNVSVDESTLPLFIQGALLSSSEAQLTDLLTSIRQEMDKDLAAVDPGRGDETRELRLKNFPRLQGRTSVWRRLVLGLRQFDAAADFDRRLLKTFPDDAVLAMEVVSSRANLGLEQAAKDLLAASALKDDPAVRVAAGVIDASANSLSVAAAAKMLIPGLGGDPATLRDILERVDTGNMTAADESAIPTLLAASLLVDARDSGERFARAGMRKGDFRRGYGNMWAVLSMADRLSSNLAKNLLRDKMRSLRDKGGVSMIYFRQLDVALGGGSLSSDAATEIVIDAAKSQSPGGYFYGSEMVAYVDADKRTQVVRDVYQELPPSQRPRMLAQVIGFMGDAVIEESFVDWFGQALKVSLEANGGNILGGLRIPPTAGANIAALTLRAAEISDQFKPDPINIPVKAGALFDLGRTEEGIKVVLDGADALLASPRASYDLRQLTTKLGVPKHKDVANELFRRLTEKHPENKVLKAARWQHLRKSPADYRAALESELAAHPKDPSTLSRLAIVELQAGAVMKSVRLLEALCALEKNASYERRLVAGWNKLSHPINAAAVGKVKATKPSEPKGANGRATGSRATRVAVPLAAPLAALRVVGTTTSVVIRPSATAVSQPSAASSRPGPLDAKLTAIVALHKAGKTNEAKSAFRRHWRNFDPPNQYVKFPQNLSYYGRGGSQNIRSIFGRLESELPFIAAEARAVLTVLAADDPIGSRFRPEIIDIVARDIHKSGKGAETLAIQEARLLAGKASTDDVEVMLRLYALEKDSSASAEVVAALVSRPELPSSDRLERIAGLCAATGDLKRAAQLFRMSVLSSNATLGRPVFFRGGPSRLDTLRPQIEAIYGDDSKALVLALVDDMRVSMPMGQSLAWANLAVKAWAELLPVGEAGARIVALAKEERRNAAARASLRNSRPGFTPVVKLDDVAALTMARAGLVDEAIVELSATLLLRPDVAARTGDAASVNKTLVAVVEGEGEWMDKTAFIKSLTKQVIAWNAESKLRAASTVLGVMGRVSKAAGEVDLASQCADELMRAMASRPAVTRPVDRVALADALRGVGLDEKAEAIEESLLSIDALPVDRIASVVTRIIERDGAEAGMKVGLRAAEYTMHPDLLNLLAQTAESMGDDEGAQEWRKKRAGLDQVKEPVSPKAATRQTVR